MLSTRSKHAVRALLELAEYKRTEYVQVDVLAKDVNLPAPFLSKLMKELAREELVYTKKGRNGGVCLPKKQITVHSICEALKDPVAIDHCFLSRKKCSINSPCPLHEKWSKERLKIKSFLKSLKI